MTPARFLKVTTVTSATLALLAGTAIPSAYAEDAGVPAPPAQVISDALIVQGFSALFQPDDTVKTTDGLLVATADTVKVNPDKTIQGASGVSTYDLSKIALELDGKTVKANASAAINSNSGSARALGAWDTNNAGVVTVDASGNLTAVADGTAFIGFIPAVIEGETVTYPDEFFALEVTVANGVITAAKSASSDDSVPVEVVAPVAGFPIGTPMKLADGVLFYISDKPTLAADGTATGMVTVPSKAFDGTVLQIRNLDSLTVGSVVDAGADYTNAAGRAELEALLSKNPGATLGGVLISSDESVISVDDNTATVVGSGTATLTFTVTLVRDGVVVESDVAFSQTITVENPSTTVPVPVPSKPAPSESAKPEPSESAKPTPSESAKPEPSESAKPTPSESAKPEPSESAPAEPTPSAPAPSESAKPEPSESAKPAPSESAPAESVPAPSAPVKPVPSESVPAIEEPVVKVTPNPSVAPGSPDDKPFVYEDCAEVYEAGAAPIRKGDRGWDDSLDTDNDGVGCELTPDYASDASKKDAQGAAQGSQSKNKLANTGAEAAGPLLVGFGLLALGASAVLASRYRRRAN